jgi:hypothetical protein
MLGVNVMILAIFGHYFVENITITSILLEHITSNSGVNVIISVFGDFRLFSSERLAFFLKKHCYDPLFAQPSGNFRKSVVFSPNFSAKIFLKL